MKNLKKIFCLILVLVMSFGPSVNIFAASTEEKYVSDIKIGYGEDGKNALIANGYKVDSSFNANDSGRGDSVWIGFKTTSNPLDAITDVAVMNMNGDYTYSTWLEEYEELQAQINDMLADFIAGIEEFRKNLEKGSPYAQAALELMNEFVDSEFTKKRIGDLFKSSTTTNEELSNIFMMGNYQFVSAIKQCIAMACTEWENPENTFADKLNKNGYFSGTVDPGYNHERELISKAISNMKADIDELDESTEQYYSSYSLVKDDYKLEAKDIPEGTTGAALDTLQFENYLSQTLTEDQLSNYNYNKRITTILKSITIKPENKNSEGEITQARESFYDLVKKDEASLTENDFETIRLTMTSGQLGVVETVGFPILLFYAEMAKTDTFEDNYEEVKESVEEEYDSDTISVYYGVDVAAFTDRTNTALTGSAHVALKSFSDFTYGSKSSANKETVTSKTKKIAYIVGGAGAALGLAIGITGMLLRRSLIITASTLKGTFTVGGVVCVIAVVAFIIILCQDKTVEKPKEEADITYTKIPRCIVDVKTVKLKGVAEQKIYYTYTCAKRIDAVDSDNTMLVYGDLNGYNKKNEWVAVYYTKNRDLGNPITASVLSSASSEAKTGYLAIHDFGTSGATNLNRYNSASDKKEIYGFIKTTTFDDEEDNQQMSVFGDGTAMLYLVSSFAAGAFVSGLAVHRFTKKKYRKAQ